jgi:hypothetical protein
VSLGRTAKSRSSVRGDSIKERLRRDNQGEN